MIRKAYIDTRGGQVHYRYTTGGSGSPIVLFHMNPSTSESYENLMQELDGKIPAYAIDTPNYGESYRTDAEPTMAYIGDVMLEVMTNLGVSSFHVFGHHTGASISLELACAAPDRIISATLSGIVPVTPEEGAQLIRELAYPNTPDHHGSQLMKAWTRTLSLENIHSGVKFPVEIKHRECVAMLKAGANFGWAYRAVFSDDAQSKLAGVEVPIFFVIGEHDTAMPYHKRMVELYPQFPSYIGPDHGTFYCETAPEDLTPRLIDFIRASEFKSKN